MIILIILSLTAIALGGYVAVGVVREIFKENEENGQTDL